MSRAMALAEDTLREALMKLRVHGTPWWHDEWSVSKIAHDALNEADRILTEAATQPTGQTSRG